MSDLLSIVEAAYRSAVDEPTWLRLLLESAGAIERGGGLWGQTYRVRPSGVRILSSVGQNPAYGPAQQNARLELYSTQTVASSYPQRAAVSSFLQISGLPEREAGQAFEHMGTGNFRDTGYIDALGVLAGDPSGFGCVLCSPSQTRVRVAPREAQLLTRVAVHVAHAYRLRRANASGVAPDAVLDPDGRVQHLETARVDADDATAIREATRRIDRARGKLRRASQEESFALWRGLVCGQWSLVDQIDHDGRRYVLARRNPLETQDWSTLTLREREVVAYAAHGQSQKIIAYQLGLAPSTVGTYLSVAARKVGARSRTRLLAAYLRDHAANEPQQAAAALGKK